MNEKGNTMNNALNRYLAACIVASLVLIVLMVSNVRAYAQPYGGCDEAYLYPRSAGAADCRALGWTIRKRVVIGPKGWVHFNRLPACEYEDSWGCYWNARTMGDGRGSSSVNLLRKGGTDAHIVIVVTRSLR